jgi:hypothetical protein
MSIIIKREKGEKIMRETRIDSEGVLRYRDNQRRVEAGFKVYQTKDWEINSKLHFLEEDEVPGDHDRSNYHLVAELPGGLGIEDVYRLTNSIERSWWENPLVRPMFRAEGCRSTSIGDVIVDVGKDQAFICLSVGWKEINFNRLGIRLPAYVVKWIKDQDNN